MTWAQSYLLALLAAVAILALGARWWAARRRTAARGIGATAAHLTGAIGAGRVRLAAALCWVGLGLVVIALAGPRWGAEETTRTANGADVVLLLDCSRSMLATDLHPNRLEAARRKALDLLKAAPETRMALMPFAGVAALRCPLTGDHLAMVEMLNDCDPDLFPADAGYQGTAIGVAVREALTVLGRQVERSQAVLLLSDGADDDANSVTAAAAAAKAAGVPVHGLFLGDSERTTRILIDGKEQIVAAEKKSLDELATATGGISVNATTDGSDVAALAAALAAKTGDRPWEERMRLVARERYQWALIPGILLIALGVLLPTRLRTPRSLATLALLFAALHLPAAEPWSATTAAAALPPTEARRALEAVLAERPDFLPARFNLGCVLLGTDPAAAATQFLAATNAADADLVGQAWHNLALARFAEGRLDEALAAAQQAAERRPAAAGLRDEMRRAVLKRRDEARLKAEAEARRPHLDNTPLPAARVGTAYAAQIPVRGAHPAFTVALAKGTPPPGLTIAADGRITGTPTTAGDHTLELKLSDATKDSADAKQALRIRAAAAITTTTLPEAVTGLPYQATLQVSDLDQPRWQVARLPTGLTCDERGVISGTPTAAGPATLHVHVTGADGATADRMIELAVIDGFTADQRVLPPATAGAPYRHRVGVRGPDQAYRWSAPAALAVTIAEDGTVTGTPREATTLEIPTTLSAADGRSRNVPLTLPVNPPPVIAVEGPLTVQAGSPVHQALKSEGGTPPLSWSSDSGLPAGLRLDADGHLRGATTVVGKASVVVHLKDRWNAETQTTVEISVEPRKDEPKKDEQKQDEQDQSKDGKDGKDGKGGKGAPKPQDDKPGKDGKQGQQQADSTPKPTPSPDNKDGKDGKDSKQADAQQAAAQLQESAADRFLDHLPAEDKQVLRWQLLDGGDRKAEPKGNPW